jgi:hypothetical protein
MESQKYEIDISPYDTAYTDEQRSKMGSRCRAVFVKTLFDAFD